MTIKQRIAMKKLIERHTKVATASKVSARTALIRPGIYTAEGHLAPDFGGKQKTVATVK